VPYADTSFLVSYYGQDAHSAAALAALSAGQVPLPFTAPHRLELRNALELAVQRGHLTGGGVRLVWAVVLGDVRRKRLLRPAVDWQSAWRRAAQLSARHTQRLATRSFDILHVAVAQNLGTREFFSFDHRQRQLAAVEGMVVLP
jgi:predicted nucleic acid-binding protein